MQDASQKLKEHYTGYIIHFGNYDRNDTILFALISGQRFSEALSIRQFQKGTKELFFITLDGKNIEYCCLAEKKRRVVTDKFKVEFYDFVRLSPSLNIDGLTEELQSSLQRHFIRSTSGNGGSISPKTWQSLLEIIERNNIENFDSILRLFSKRHTHISQPDEKGITTFRKDASSFALNLGEIDLKKGETTLKISYKDSPEIHEKNDSLPPFLSGLEAPTILLEDQMIFHDCSVFDDWERLDVRPDVTAQFKQGRRTVTISNFNRHPVEQQTGVDLLYFHHYFNSYILIQYKRLDPNEKVFRPSDATYKKEFDNMQRMLEVVGVKQNSYSSLIEYRVNEMFCFFKLCEAKPINHNSGELIKGMYFPLDLWKLLLESEETTGRNGGKRIGYDHVDGRYFNNTQFIDLFKNGWIGSSNLSSQKITDIIAEILANKHSLILASSDNKNRPNNIF